MVAYADNLFAAIQGSAAQPAVLVSVCVGSQQLQAILLRLRMDLYPADGMPWPRSHVSPQMSVAFLVLHVIAIRLPSRVVSMAWPRSITAVLRQRGRLPEYAIASGWVGFLLTACLFRAQAWCPRLWSSCL